MTDAWLPISELPEPGKRPGRVFVVVEGLKEHSGNLWKRQHAGIASTHNEGFGERDMAYIEEAGDMDQGTGVVTHWLPITFPPFPQTL
ncbi:hypothetical protein [Hyphomicrobium sp. MC1]|uniref:hypothetical protein n=1 Tax=Hyphomicrobium sp. (strain MC1) TaxID=717785 RepID=UPI000213DCE3|nr:hypothetical protein [Hyphomicrobium sp. MC1]CCB64492.1 protein of unknown function [Hyphomicrobium sp. MC1]